LQELEGVSFRHAAEMLRKLAGQAGGEASLLAKQTKIQEKEEFAASEDDAGLMAQVVEFYHKNLFEKAEAKAYLEKRGLYDEEMLGRFRVGYADRSLGYQLSRDSKSRIRQQLKRVGLLRAETGHEHFTGSIVIPIFDEKGLVVGMYGRKVHDDLRSRSPKHLYLPGPHKGIWNKEGLEGSEEVIICEALLDALTFWKAGIKNVTSAYGIQGMTEELREYLKKSQARLVFAYDSDEPGNNAAIKEAERLLSEGMQCYRLSVPMPCKDINEYALAHGEHAGRMLGILLEEARPLGASEPRRRRVLEAAEARHEESQVRTEPPQKEEQKPPQPPREEQAARKEEAVLSLAADAAEKAAVAAAGAPIAAGVGSLLKVEGDRAQMKLGGRLWSVRGLERQMGQEQMKLTVQCAAGDAFHIDTLDLYNAKARGFFLKFASEEVGISEQVLKADLGKLLGALEETIESRLIAALKPKGKAVEITEEERLEALAFLRNPRLLTQILEDFEKVGLVGEDNNKLLVYLACCSRKLPRPLSVLVQSNSAAGKSSLIEGVLAFMPEEDCVQYSALTGQALYYFEEQSLERKILAIAEEEGARRASYALKQLLSEGKLTIAAPGKDAQTGKQVTHEYAVYGKPAMLSTTTAADMDEELMNRCLVLAVDEGREQTQAIHEQQRKARLLDGLWAKEQREELLLLHQNAQRLLEPLYVVNPYASKLTFLNDRTRTRRDHPKYLSLIEAIALLHQYQRPVKSSQFKGKVKNYVEVRLSDIELANRLMNEALGRSLDELAPQTRRLLHLIEELVCKLSKEQQVKASEVRVRAKDVREYSGWSATQVKVHLKKLSDLEYLLLHRAPRGQNYLYELLYDGQGKDGKPFVLGLLEPGSLKEEVGLEYDQGWSGGWTEENESWAYRKPTLVLGGFGVVQDGQEEPLKGHEEGKNSAKSEKRIYREGSPVVNVNVSAGRNGKQAVGGQL